MNYVNCLNSVKIGFAGDFMVNLILINPEL
jgi:hypothetical protein